MKYILIASLLSCAAYAAPFAQQGQTTQPQQAQRGGQQQGQQQQQGTQGVQGVQNGQNGQNSQSGQANAPTNGPQTGTGAGIANGQTPSAADLATAVANWQADTSMVSNFLNTGKGIQNNVQFKQAATVAFNAEVDELNHKAIIDAANGNQPGVIAANSTLATGGSFQDVVNKLQLMSQQGMAAVANIDLINQNRCVNVLPNIDAYMASTGSSSQAIRPTVCDQTGVAGGVQGTGATQPGAPAGSPAAAFAAAQALASGTGNGLVQNGASAGTGNAQQGQQQAGQAQQGQQQAGQAQQGQQQAGQAQQQTPPTQAQTPTQGQAAQGQAGQQQGTTPALQAAQGQAGQQQGATPAQAQQSAAPAQQQQGQQAQAGAAAGSTTQGQKGQGQAASQTKGQGQAAQGQKAGGAAKGQAGGAAKGAANQ